MSPACSTTYPMKMKRGTAARVCSFIRPMVWKKARSKTMVPSPK